MILLAVATVAFGLLVVAWILYPLAMWFRGRGSASRAPEGEPVERVVVVVATRDDPAFALERVRNLRAVVASPDAAADAGVRERRGRAVRGGTAEGRIRRSL